MFLLHSAHISDRIFAQCLQPLSYRQQKCDGLICQRCGLGKFDKRRPIAPCGWIADSIARDFLVSTPRDLQQPLLPVLFSCTYRPVVQGCDQWPAYAGCRHATRDTRLVFLDLAQSCVSERTFVPAVCLHREADLGR